MRKWGVALGLVVAASLVPSGDARGQAAGRKGLQDALGQRYRLAEVGPSMLGVLGGRASIRRAGGVVVLRRAGLFGSLDRDNPASFYIREGTAEMFRGRKDYAYEVGEKFYVHSVYAGTDVVVIGLVTTRIVSTQTNSGRLWTAASFFFPAEVLRDGHVGKVFRVLDQWFLPEEGLRPVITDPAAAQPQPRPQPTAPSPGPSATPTSAPAELKPGMSRNEIVAALGPPKQAASFGSRTWLTYPGMVVLLNEDKLVSVDENGQPPAKVLVSSEPDGADVFLDGSFVSSTPAKLKLPAGTYKVTVRSPGYQEWEREVRVLAGSEITLRARLEK